jgi:curved DNA-binding protein CbpA
MNRQGDKNSYSFNTLNNTKNNVSNYEITTGNSSSINPYKVLGVNKKFTLDELRTNFKKIALIHHPDKGGDPEVFKLISLCYKKLFQEYKLRETEKQFSELKFSSKNYIEEQSNNNYKNTELKQDYSNNNEFQKNFNETFDKFKVSTVYDQGYGDRMNPHNDVREEINIKNNIGKYNNERFNNKFNKQQINTDKNIIKYETPEPLMSMKALQYTEIGISQINDFSGENETLKKLNYTDYMKAYTTTRLIDPESVKERKNFKTMEDIKAHREKISYQMTENDIRKEKIKELQQKKAEEKRQLFLQEQDRVYFERFNQTNKMMLKFR